ncbi:MAG: ribosomal RNA small subunit methyltransferase A [Gemmatimonadetes bacterium]|nr:ribosomal RNA small subunit methyltransferase A [Gemmatimonadota bacterium]
MRAPTSRPTIAPRSSCAPSPPEPASEFAAVNSDCGHAPARAKKSLGQNFLIDPNLQRKIVQALAAGPDDEVLEIGPGRGALTAHLIGRPRRLILVELDDRLAADLVERWGARPDVQVVHGDALEVDLPGLAERPHALKVLGNIPYNITSPLLFRLLKRPRPAQILVMVQREVAERLLADAGTSEYGALAVGVRSVADVERVLHVPRQAFRPVPRVDSTVVRITPHDPPRLTEHDEKALRVLVRACFQWRRKQLQKTLREHPDLLLDRALLEPIGAATGFDLSERPERLSPEELLALSRAIAAILG